MGRDGTGRDFDTIFGRTDLRISQSKAKCDARADGEVRLAVRRPKPRKICKKIYISENFDVLVFSASKNETSGIV